VPAHDEPERGRDVPHGRAGRQRHRATGPFGRLDDLHRAPRGELAPGQFPDAAARTYQDILDRYPDDASARARLAELYRQGGDPERAHDFARQALIREPKTLAAYKVMMLSYLDRKQLSMAKLVARA
jgi:tetratricopeptide (TPR) repeat protein